MSSLCISPVIFDIASKNNLSSIVTSSIWSLLANNSLDLSIALMPSLIKLTCLSVVSTLSSESTEFLLTKKASKLISKFSIFVDSLADISINLIFWSIPQETGRNQVECFIKQSAEQKARTPVPVLSTAHTHNSHYE